MVKKSEAVGAAGGVVLLLITPGGPLVAIPTAFIGGYAIHHASNWLIFKEYNEHNECEENLTDAKKLISTAVKNNEISRQKAEELLINLENNKITPDSIKAMFGE